MKPFTCTPLTLPRVTGLCCFRSLVAVDKARRDKPGLIFGLLLLLPILCATSFAAESSTRPHVVVVLADDIGPGDVGFFHRQRTGKPPVAPTPNLDRLVAAGIRFVDAHSSTALCAPTRYSVMTGNYTHRCHEPWGVWGSFSPSAIGERDLTLGQLMTRAGYRTCFVGKWHLGAAWNAVGSDQPYRGNAFGNEDGGASVDCRRIVRAGTGDLGFADSLMLLSGIQHMPYAYYRNDVWEPVSPDSKQIPLSYKNIPKGSKLGRRPGIGDSHYDSREVGRRLAEKGADFIRVAASHPKQPLFLYYCSQAVHHPHTPPDELNGTKIAGTTPSDHLDMVVELDQQVGVLIRALEEVGIQEDTLFIFTSDNGGLGQAESLAAGHDSSNGLRDFKGSIYEGGHRVPFIAVWPGRIAADSVSSEPVLTHDIMATLASLTRQKLGENEARDSISLMPLLLGEPGAQGRREHLQFGAGSNRHIALRDGPWKLVVQQDKVDADKFTPFGLFNLNDNPTEDDSVNLFADSDHKERVESMIRQLREIWISKRSR